MDEQEFDHENDPEEEESNHYPLEIIVLGTVMTISIILSVQHIIDNSTSIVISSLIILYGAYGIYRR